MEISCRLLRCGAKVEQQPSSLYHGTWVTAELGQGTAAHRPLVIRDFLSTLRLSLLLLFSFLQEKKKWNRNLKYMKFHTGNEIVTTDRAEQNSAGGSAEDVLKGEVAKLMNKLTDSATLQNRLVKCRLSQTHKKAKLCRHYGIYLLSCSWCQVLACTAGHWHFLCNPSTALAQSPAAALSFELPWPAGATHPAPGGHFRRNTPTSYRSLNEHYLPIVLEV